ncbi:MAG: hypothetical protein AAFV07_13160 [Bacteroidota bacterium]
MNQTTTRSQARRLGGRAAIMFLGLALLASSIYVKHHAFLWQKLSWIYGAALLGLIGLIYILGRQVGVRILVEEEKPLMMGTGLAFCVLTTYSAVDTLFLMSGFPMDQTAFLNLFAQTFLTGSLPFAAMGLVLGMHLQLIRPQYAGSW